MTQSKQQTGWGGLAVSLAGLVLAACGNSVDVDSETIETRNLWVGMTAEAPGNGGTSINVEINNESSSGENVRLSASERLEASANGNVIVLEEDSDLFDIDYEGQLPSDAGGVVTLSLFRADGSVNSSTRVTLPDPFTVSSPVNDQAATVGDSISVVWNGGALSGVINVQATAQCSGFTRSEFRDVADDGVYVIDTGAIPGILDPDVPRDNGCELTIRLVRERRGTLDPAFRGGGFVRAEQARSVVMTLTF